MSRVRRVRNWCYTYHVQHVEELETPPIDPRYYKYMIAQLEVAPSTGKIHWQGYVQFETALTLGGVRKLCETAHWEGARGTPDENVAYCTKSESRMSGSIPWEDGIRKTPGKRSDLESFYEDVEAGKRLCDLHADHHVILAKYPRHYGTLRYAMKPVFTGEEREVIVLLGPTGCGKSTYVHTLEKSLWLSNCSSWYDGYEGEPAAFFDEFCGEIPFQEYKLITNKFLVRRQIKGGFVWFHPKRIYFASNSKTPQDWYDFKTGKLKVGDYKALLKRMSCVMLWNDDKIYSAMESGAPVAPDHVYKTQAEINAAFPFTH